MKASEIISELEALADPAEAEKAQRFFKTGPGEYGEGDLFRGVRVPALRALAKKHRTLALPEALELLRSRFHEDRLLALFLLVDLFKKGGTAAKGAIYRAYLENTRFINNWDLVDSSAQHIVGPFLLERDRKPLYRLAESKDLWERRIAVIATLHFLRKGDFRDTLELSEKLLSDREDLLHKATGWMLREVGKRDRAVLEAFLEKWAARMPRTMLRYAIERLPEQERRRFLGMRAAER